VLIGGTLRSAVALATTLREVGAGPCFALVLGVPGPEPDEGLEGWWAIPAEGRDPVEIIIDYGRRLERLSAPAIEVLDRFDPDRSALVLGAQFVEAHRIAGRPVWGRRRRRWTALEDKVLADALWDEAGVVRAPAAVVSPEPAALRAAARRLDRGDGTVWAPDAPSGGTGGTRGLVWVRSDEEAAEAAARMAGRCAGVRVMPFLEGVPCSIHGTVLPGGVSALRPVEMLTLRRPGGGLVYAGFATMWDPRPDDRQAMREVAHRVGRRLAEGAAYRGGFTVDGVMSAEGFRPTELNARHGAGLYAMERATGLPLPLFSMAAAAGALPDVPPAEIEEAVLPLVDARRGAAVRVEVDADVREPRSLDAVDDGRAARPAAEGEARTARVEVVPGSPMTLARVDVDPARVPPGPSLAPRAARLLALADEHLGAGVGPLEAARTVR
jgi:hypothetical protein